MTLETEHAESATVEVENVGGIDETAVEFTPGCTILVGRNATNRTSFLRAVMAALGSDDVSIKGNADRASVTLTLGDETYTRTLRRDGADVVTDGDPYLADSELADLFAFLLESQEARRAVTQQSGLREVIMRPIDTDEIEAEIADRVGEREALEEEKEAIADLKGELPDLEERRTQLDERIEGTRAELEETEAALEAADDDVSERREQKETLERRLDELQSKRSALDDVRYDLETERTGLEALEAERRELEEELAEMPESPAGELEELRGTIDRLRERKRTLEGELREIRDVIGFNEEMLAEANATVFEALEDDGTAVTDQLVGEEVACWTCGNTVERERIESTIETLQDQSSAKVEEIAELDDRLQEATSRTSELREAQDRRERTRRRLDEIEREIDAAEETIGDLEDRREELLAEIESVEAAVDDLETEGDSEILDLHREANQLEYDLGSLESEHERVSEEIARIEGRLEEVDEIDERITALDEEITELRTTIERIEETAIEEFNEHMDTILEILDYDNLDRIWLERVTETTRRGRRTVEEATYELHIVRQSDAGVAYEDTIEHLSESETEVTGLVFALAGYLAHEVHETIPVMVLDSVEAIDSDRIAGLVQYLEDYAEYLLVALLPEDAAALPEDYERVTEI